MQTPEEIIESPQVQHLFTHDGRGREFKRAVMIKLIKKIQEEAYGEGYKEAFNLPRHLPV